ncbi:MAG TPA: FkbM family methyltransferase [Longimicrobiaceae bacterium]|nr:FkbM family methyltransferase [Longimicrobiaceae bacterium]
MVGIVANLRRLVRGIGLDVVSYPRWNTAPWALKHLLPQLRITCVLDVGGHHGEYGLMLREMGYQGHIVSFEPVPESFAVLKERCAGDPRWHAHPYALGAEAGVLPLHITRESDFVSFLDPDLERGGHFATALAVERSQEVPVKRLDEVLDDCIAHISDPVLFLKSDTQGYDFHVLEGLGARIGEIRGLQIEVALQPLYRGMKGFNESISTLGELGFELFCLSPITHDESYRVIEYDCLMRRAPTST